MESGGAWAKERAWLATRGGPWTRSDRWLVAAIVVAVLARWPDRARYLWSWDSHTFAIALTDYDVNGLHPHAPGYPLYVAMGRASYALFGNANDAYIAIGLLATAAALVLVYDLGRRIFSRGIALAATTLLVASPLVYVHSVTANVYPADLLSSAAVAWLAWRTHHDPSRRNVIYLAAAAACAIGVRQSLAFFLGPLLVWAALRPPWDLRAQVRRLGAGIAVSVAIFLAWFVPMVMASGGLATWRRANDLQSDVVFEHPVWRDGWDIVTVNAARLGRYLRWEYEWILPVLAGALAAVLLARLLRGGNPLSLRSWTWPSSWETPGSFLLLWLVPPAAFYLTVYSGYGNGPSGYALILLPPAFLACCAAAAWTLGRLRLKPGLAAVMAGVLLLVPTLGLAANNHEVADGSYREHDAWVDNWMALPQSFPPTNTSIVSAYNFAHLWYYYPDYHIYEYRPAGKAVGEVPDFTMIQHAKDRVATPDWYDEIAEHKTALPNPLPLGIENLVLFDFQLAGENDGTRQLKDDVTVYESWLPNGWRILYVKVTPDRPNLEDYFTLEGAAR